MPKYKYDPLTEEMICIDPRHGKLRSSVHWPEGADANNGYYSEGCGVRFKSKDHKRQHLKEKGIAEV